MDTSLMDVSLETLAKRVARLEASVFGKGPVDVPPAEEPPGYQDPEDDDDDA